MRGGFFIGLDTDLYQQLATTMAQLAGAGDPASPVAQLVDAEGRLFTLDECMPGIGEWEYREGPFTAGPSVQIPDMQSVTACMFACRWPDMVVHLAQILASRTRGPLWLLDGNGMVWDASAVDPAAVTL